MIVVRLNGGLGNQLFQYAAGYALALRNQELLMLDITGFLSHNPNLKQSYRSLDILDYEIEFSESISGSRLMGIRYPWGIFSRVSDFIQKRIFKRYYVDWHPDILLKNGQVYLDGYYQSELYFSGFRDEISKQFQLKKTFLDGVKNIVEMIQASNNSISIHVRRGDYITNPRANKIHNVCTKNYFYRSLDYLSSRLDDFRIFIFSDDIDWVKTEMTLPESTVYVSDLLQLSGERLRSSQEMYLMSLCQYNVISNSSFSWWGAYLNRFNEKIVLAPSVWSKSKVISHKNILPAEWIQISA